MIHRPFSTAMVDLLLCTVVLLTLLINPPGKKEFEAQGDYQIHMEWDETVAIDMDMYLLLPTGEAVWFSAKNRDFAYITRDDLGLNQGKYNQEVIWLEVPVDGTYCLSIHNYTTDPSLSNDPHPKDYIKGDVEVKVFDRAGSIIYKMSKPMPSFKEETPMFCFDVVSEDLMPQSFRPSDQYIRNAGKANATPTDGTAPNPHPNARRGPTVNIR